MLTFKETKKDQYLGGVLSIARNLSQFTNKVSVLSMIGENKEYYEIVELANTSSLPYTRSLEISVISDDNYDELDQDVGLHQYIYNVGNKELVINFENGFEKLHPGDSCYIKPFFKHNFRGNGKLLCLRIGGRIGGDPHRELSIIGRKNSERAISESLPWFNVEVSN